jgi:hypothetical protein
VPAPGAPEPADPVPAGPLPADPQPVEPEPVDPAAAVDPPPAVERARAVEDAVAAALPEARFSLRAIAWTASLALAVLLAIASIALTVFAIAGGSL